MEIACEEGGFSQSHFFSLPTEEEERRPAADGDASARGEKLQTVKISDAATPGICLILPWRFVVNVEFVKKFAGKCCVCIFS